MCFIVISDRQIISEQTSERAANRIAMVERRHGRNAYVITYAK